MAKGIDSYARTACLHAGGYTVAILGNGLDICYPSEHNKLMECIEQNGLLLSEYPPGTRPTQYTFPRKNRLISAWAERIIVIAPGKGSGALITAEYKSEDDWRAIQETLHLDFIPGMMQSILEGAKEALDDCISEDRVRWL